MIIKLVLDARNKGSIQDIQELLERSSLEFSQHNNKPSLGDITFIFNPEGHTLVNLIPVLEKYAYYMTCSWYLGTKPASMYEQEDLLKPLVSLKLSDDDIRVVPVHVLRRFITGEKAISSLDEEWEKIIRAIAREWLASEIGE